MQRLEEVDAGGGRGMNFQTGIKSIPGDTRSNPQRDQGRRDSRKVLRPNKSLTAKYEEGNDVERRGVEISVEEITKRHHEMSP